MTGRPHPLRWSALLAVAVGGAVGACLRWELSRRFPVAPEGFPWTTFAINVSGSVLLAVLPAIAFVRRHPILPPALGTGVLGGYTTLSTYSEETRGLLASGHGATALLYLLGTLAACLVGVALVDHVSDLVARMEFEDEEGDL